MLLRQLNSTYTLLFLLFSALFLTTACGDDDGLSYEIPTTYNFDNVSYSGQTQRLAMLTELKTYMQTANTQGTTLNVNKLKAMFANTPAAGFAGTYDESKQLKSKTLESEVAAFDALFEQLATASQSTVDGSEGVAGVIGDYLVGAEGLEYNQIIEKGLMGACLYYQATGVYLASDKMDVDNETIEAGEGTAMEHHWDEAFGYLGIPISFPSDLDGLLFWGNYANKRDGLLESNATLMDAFLKGRAAISNKDLSTRDETIGEIRTAWELVVVGTALHYLNDGIANFDDLATRSHALSEAIGFIYSLKFNPARTASLDETNALLELVGGSSTFESMNLYAASVERLQMAKDDLAALYRLEAQKDEF